MSGAVTYPGGNSVIWRFDVKIDDEPTILDIPKSSKVVHVGMDGRTPWRHVTVWILMPIDAAGQLCAPQPQSFYVHGTRHRIPPGRRHVGTVFDPPSGDVNPLVWHVFEGARV